MARINNSHFDSNSALIGGAIFVASTKTMNSNNTTFTNNNTVEGSAIASNAKLTVANSTFKNNNAITESNSSS